VQEAGSPCGIFLSRRGALDHACRRARIRSPDRIDNNRVEAPRLVTLNILDHSNQFVPGPPLVNEVSGSIDTDRADRFVAATGLICILCVLLVLFFSVFSVI